MNEKQQEAFEELRVKFNIGIDAAKAIIAFIEVMMGEAYDEGSESGASPYDGTHSEL